MDKYVFLCVVVYATRLSSRRVPWPLLNVTLLQSNSGECFSVICIYIYILYIQVYYFYIYTYISFFFPRFFHFMLFCLFQDIIEHIYQNVFLATSLHFAASSWPSCLSAVQLCSCATLNSIPLNSVPLKWNYFDIILVDLGRFE